MPKGVGVVTKTGNPAYVTAGSTWVFRNTSRTISHAVVYSVSADTADAVVLSKDDSGAEASILATRDVKSGVNTVIWPEPITLCNLYVNTLSAGKIRFHYE